MTQEERKLLLADLCGRIPHNTKVLLVYSDGTSETREMGLGGLHDIMVGNAEGKPFLRPMSSMTEVEKRDYEYITERWMYDTEHTISESIDWLNERHFDHRGLIDMGLALEAPEGMYGAESCIPKDPNTLGIKDEFDKDEVMGVLGAVYDFWKAKETKGVRNGCGRSGLDGMTTVDVWRLFNQMLVVLSRAAKHVENE